MSGPSALVFDADPRRPWLVERSARSLRHAGMRDVVTISRGENPRASKGPMLILRAGAWLRHPTLLTPPPASATGRDLVAIGIPASGAEAENWRTIRHQCGGDFSRESNLTVVCAWVMSDDAQFVSRVIAGDVGDARVLHWPAVDVDDDVERLRVVQVVTSLQQGGAERVTWDLHDLLPVFGVDSCLVTLGRPMRRSLPIPRHHIDLSPLESTRRAEAIEAIAIRFGADVIHAHLVRADDATRIAQSGVPLVITAHNTRPGWPEGLERTGASLMVACAQAVERDLITAGAAGPIRTAWNGIDVGAFASIAPNRDPNRLTLACVANPRPQKRLDRLPAVLAAVRKWRDARLIVCGELPAGPDDPGGARNALEDFRREAKSHGVERFVEFTDGRRDVREVLAVADVFISLSAHEGLSLAQLEALAASVPVVTTNVGGAAEVAHGNRAVTLLPQDIQPLDAAQSILQAASVRPDADTVRRDFSRERMADRYAWLYRAVHEPARGDTLWFVANNLCTGGAQSSLRRLAKSLHAKGERVRVAVLQEYADTPTPGREDLLQAGIPVMVLPPAGSIDPADAVELLLAEMRAAPPRSVTFWNAIQSYKVLLADALLHVLVFDVSPGEMFYDSMDAYFTRPRSGLPYRTPGDYGERLAGVIVKYSAEAERAAKTLGTRVLVIPNGVSLRPERSSVRERVDGRFVIGTAARIHPHKRLEDLLDAFRLAMPRLPRGVLRIAGGADSGCDDYANDLRMRYTDVPVEWLGEIADAGAFHDGLDVFAMISEPAGCPNASLEAMAAGLPVVATDVGGAGEQVVDGVTGRLVARRDVGAFAEALVQMGTCADCRARFGAAARQRIEERFSLERMTRDYQNILHANSLEEPAR